MHARLLRPIARLATALLAPLLLASCVLTPGKFTSTLRIDADGSFAFSYVGEVIDAEPDGADALADLGDDDEKQSPAQKAQTKAEKAAKHKADAEAKHREIAAALAKEAGYRKVTYLGDGKFLIDYAISGKLTHDFVWPFNLDAEVIIPFVAVELRQGGTVRVKAPAFANDESAKSVPGMSGMAGSVGNVSSAAGGSGSQLDGSFTLDTDATIISQNNEDGVTTTGARKTIVWKATPLTKAAPMAVLKLVP